MRIPSAVFVAALILSSAGAAQEPAKRLACQERGAPDGRQRGCEIREITLAAAGRLEVDAGPGGGVAVRPWSRAETLVRAKVEAWGGTKPSDVRVNATPGKVSSEGPKAQMGWSSGWSVSFEVFVPERTDLEARTVNGGITVEGVRGEILARTTNGGITLEGVGGRVEGKTVNGGIRLKLAGKAWEGDSCTLATTNGGVNVDVPRDYSARFVAETRNGGIHSAIPDAKVERGRGTGGKLEATAGTGGALIRVTAVNGGVTIRQEGAAQI